MRWAADWGRFLRTVRHLTLRQVTARVAHAGRFALYARLPRVAGLGLGGPAHASAEGVEVLTRWLSIRHAAGPSPRQRELAAGAAVRRFDFLNRTRTFGETVDWQAPGMSRLWQYQLHYGDYVLALALGAHRDGDSAWAGHAVALMEHWILANPPGRRPGWEPYPLSLRVVNWALALAALGPRADEARRAPILASLAAQTRFLSRHLEWHLGGNHVVKNARALVVLGVALDCPEAAGWRKKGSRVLLEQMRRQVLPDGGHVERSPLYHGIVMEDLLDFLTLAAVRREPLLSDGDVGELTAIAGRMSDWFAQMRHPDGGLALFNDCVVAGEPDPGALQDYTARVLGRPSIAASGASLPDSGYYILQQGPGRAIIDCGDVGPEELPAHAHADTLSFELSSGGRRVVVDTGTAEYALDDLRSHVRSTAAHNTVCLDGVEQSEVWASHRVGRRARPVAARIAHAAGQVRFAGAHDGYAWRGVIHHRHIVATDGAWVVVDELRGHGRHRFESYLHLHPDFRLERRDDRWVAAAPDARWQVRALGAASGEVLDGWYCPEWGRVLRAPVLRLAGEGDVPVAFGYVLAPEDAGVEMTVEADATGIWLDGRLGDTPIRIHSDRCTSSS